jgi:hypothetical protein
MSQKILFNSYIGEEFMKSTSSRIYWTNRFYRRQALTSRVNLIRPSSSG